MVSRNSSLEDRPWGAGVCVCACVCVCVCVCVHVCAFAIQPHAQASGHVRTKGQSTTFATATPVVLALVHSVRVSSGWYLHLQPHHHTPPPTCPSTCSRYL